MVAGDESRLPVSRLRQSHDEEVLVVRAHESATACEARASTGRPAGRISLNVVDGKRHVPDRSKWATAGSFCFWALFRSVLPAPCGSVSTLRPASPRSAGP